MGITRGRASAVAGIALALGFISVFTATANAKYFDLDALNDPDLASQLAGHVVLKVKEDPSLQSNATQRQAVAGQVAEFLGCDATRVARLFRHAGKHEANHEAFGLQYWFKLCAEEGESDPSFALQALETYLTTPQTSDTSLLQHVERFELGLVERTDAVPNDPLLGVQNRHYDLIRLQQAWDITMGNEDVVVQVLDTGLSPAQPDLSINLWRNPGESGSNCGNGIDDDNNGYIDECVSFRKTRFLTCNITAASVTTSQMIWVAST